MIKKESVVDREEKESPFLVEKSGSVSSPTKEIFPNGSKKSLKKGFEAVLLYVVLVCISLAIIFIAVQVYLRCVK